MIRWLKFSKLIYILNEFTSLKVARECCSKLFIPISAFIIHAPSQDECPPQHHLSSFLCPVQSTFPFYFLFFLNLQTLSSFPVLNSQPTNCKQHQEISSLVLSSPWVANLQDTLQGRILFCSPLCLRAFAQAVSITWNALHLVFHVAVWVL